MKQIMILGCLGAFALGSLTFSPAAAAPKRPVLLELFTSQSCSSCPPAEALLANLQASRPDIAALSFHVDYWDYLSWRDPFSSPAATARQRAYAASLGTSVYTPELVVDGRDSAVGSDRAAVQAAIAAAIRAQQDGPALGVTALPSGFRVTIGAGTLPPGGATLLVAGYDPSHRTHVGSGENGGVVLDETNIVRSLNVAGAWKGAAMTLDIKRPDGARCAVFLQAADGTVLALALA